jgi:hypothetical protein
MKYGTSWKPVRFEPSCSMRADKRRNTKKLILAFRKFRDTRLKTKRGPACCRCANVLIGYETACILHSVDLADVYQCPRWSCVTVTGVGLPWTRRVWYATGTRNTKRPATVQWVSWSWTQKGFMVRFANNVLGLKEKVSGTDLKMVIYLPKHGVPVCISYSTTAVHQLSKQDFNLVIIYIYRQDSGMHRKV